ncbi:MAG: hypothetical protein NZ772_19110 [Cyanobacteria bacterium]|nr:hypothetical protein [Cyanobacteriota bacterium]MDW8203322.1 hypothetical protein [Cyanobacteriota bacterium SKYGB_h_bin112]
MFEVDDRVCDSITQGKGDRTSASRFANSQDFTFAADGKDL